MASASEQIAAAPVPAKKKGTRSKPSTDDSAAAAPTKTKGKCGVPSCEDDVSAGAKLYFTVLEDASMYPRAVEGRMSVCKAHHKCVGFVGYKPDKTQGSKLEPSCGLPSKLVFQGQAFCEACHGVFANSLLAQLKPRITTDIVTVTCRQVYEANFKEPDPVDQQIASLTAQLAAMKSKKGGTKAATAVKTEAPAKPRGKKAAAAPAPPPPPPPVLEEHESSETEEMEVSESELDDVPETQVMRPPTPPMKPPASRKLDEFEELEQATTKAEKAAAAVKASAAKGKKAAAAALKA